MLGAHLGRLDNTGHWPYDDKTSTWTTCLSAFLARRSGIAGYDSLEVEWWD